LDLSSKESEEADTQDLKIERKKRKEIGRKNGKMLSISREIPNCVSG